MSLGTPISQGSGIINNLSTNNVALPGTNQNSIAGSTLFLFLWTDGVTNTTATDNSGGTVFDGINTYTLDLAATTTVTSLLVYRCDNAASVPAGTNVTMNFTNASAECVIAMAECPGTANPSLDQHHGRAVPNAMAAFLDPGAMTTTNANDVLLNCSCYVEPAGTGAGTAHTGFVSLMNVTPDGAWKWVFTVDYQIVAATGTYNSTHNAGAGVTRAAAWNGAYQAAVVVLPPQLEHNILPVSPSLPARGRLGVQTGV